MPWFDVFTPGFACRKATPKSPTTMLWCARQAFLEQRRPLAANLRRSIAALRGKEDRDASRAPSYGQTVRCSCTTSSLAAAVGRLTFLPFAICFLLRSRGSQQRVMGLEGSWRASRRPRASHGFSTTLMTWSRHKGQGVCSDRIPSASGGLSP